MSAQSEIISKYGMPDAVYQYKYCVLWQIQKDFPWFPAKRVFINADFKKKLYAAFNKLDNLHTEIETFDGCYEQRTVRGSKFISLHSWAMAIDLNASKEKLGQVNTGWSDEFLKVMRDNGIFWGGDYVGRKDPMHFSHYNG